MIQDCLEKNDCSTLPPELQEVVFNTARNSYIGQKDGKPAVFNPNMILPYLSDGRAERISSFTEYNNALASMFPAMREKIDASIQQEQARRDKHKELMDKINTNTPEYFRAVALRQGQLNTIEALDKQNIFINNAPNSTQLQNAVAAAPTMQSDPSRLDKTNNIQPKVIKGGSGKQLSIKDQYDYPKNTTSSEQYKDFWNRIVQKHGNNPILQQVESRNIPQVIDALSKLGDTESLLDLQNTLKTATTTVNNETFITQNNKYNESLSATERALATNAIIIGMDANKIDDKNFKTDVINNTINTVLSFLPDDLVYDKQRNLIKSQLAQVNSTLSATIKNVFRSAYVSAADIAELRKAGLNTGTIRHIVHGLRDRLGVAINNAILGKSNSPIFYDAKLTNAIQTLNSKETLEAYEYIDKLAMPTFKGNKNDLRIAQMPTNGDYSKLVVQDAKGEKMYVDTTKQPPELVYVNGKPSKSGWRLF